jgi:uncharacterized protein (TIRG00374 family)
VFIPKTKRNRSILLRACFGLSAFIILVVLFDPRKIVATLAETNLKYLTIAFIASYSVILARAYRWSCILKDVGIAVSFPRLVRMYTISYWFNTFFPGSLGGDAYKVYGLFKEGASKLHALATVFIERLTGLMALVTIAAVSVIVFRDQLPTPWMLLCFIGIVIAALALFVFSLRFLDAMCRFCKRYIPFTGKILTDEFIELLKTTTEDIKNNRMMFLRAYLLGLVLQFMILASYYLVSCALGKVVPFVFFMMFFPLIEVVTMIPISINGLGVREILLVYFLKYANVGGSFAISFGVLLRILLAVFAMIGGGMLLLKDSNAEDTKA